ncbi:MAG: CoA ester lyase [Roseovarius sp.]|nr:CoA ester lyase [Roseovarius sp.]
MWRSILFIPVLQDRFINKAARRGADAIVLDLEASIASNRKLEARAALPKAVDKLAAQGMDVLVRINMLWRPAMNDLEQAIRLGVKAILLPDCKSAGEIQAVDSVMAEIERERGLERIALVPAIESAKGIMNASEIASAAQRIVALTFGIEDYLADMETAPDRETLSAAALTIAHAARSAGVDPLLVPESLANLSDHARFESAAKRGKSMGSTGGFAVHPSQVEILNRTFTPSQNEYEWCEKVISAAKKAEESGLGAVTLEGRMIDLPIIKRAKKLRERHMRFGLAQ